MSKAILGSGKSGGEQIALDVVTQEEFDAHTGDTNIHTSTEEKSKWDTHVSNADIHTTAADKIKITTHIGDTTVHTTSSEKSTWNGKANPGDITTAVNNHNSNASAHSNLVPAKAKVADHLTGLESNPTSNTWGVQTGTLAATGAAANDSAYQWRYNCPSDGKLSLKVDGEFYANEGQYKCWHSGDKIPTSVLTGKINFSAINQDTGAVVVVGSDGVCEVGQYMDFHMQPAKADYSTRIHCSTNAGIDLALPTRSGTLQISNSVLIPMESSPIRPILSTDPFTYNFPVDEIDDSMSLVIKLTGVTINGIALDFSTTGVYIADQCPIEIPVIHTASDRTYLLSLMITEPGTLTVPQTVIIISEDGTKREKITSIGEAIIKLTT